MKNLRIPFFFLQVFTILFSFQTLAQDDYNSVDSLEIDPDTNMNLDYIKSERLQFMPFRSVKGVALTSPNTYYLKYDRLFVDGLESSGDFIFIDGMQVSDGNDFPFRAIAEYQHYRLNHPIEYGNVPGSLIELKSPVFSDKFHFDIDGFTTLNSGLKNNMVELNLGGPIRFSKKKKAGFAPVFIWHPIIHLLMILIQVVSRNSW